MMIKEFIQHQILLPRLQQPSVLVVYDPARRYRALCAELASDNLRVVDASESSIESREAAMATLQLLGQPNQPIAGMLVYVPARAPQSDEERQRDPFALFAACGAIFPDGDGDEYQTLCLRAKADHATEVRRIFQNDPNPSFAVIDAVGGGAGWPNLQTSLMVESARDILFALLAPTEQQTQALKGQDAWIAEAKELLLSTLGLKLMAKIKSHDAIASELWRFLLFSEFAFDLPTQLPDALSNVPRSPNEARPLVEDLCDRLRNDRRTQALYIERAEMIEKELDLPAACQKIADLGQRDTFPFEERSFFSLAVDALKRDSVDNLRQLLGRHTQSIWVGRGENQSQWLLLQAAASLIEACEDADRELHEHIRSQDTLIDFYIGSLREIDRLQREFEQAAGEYFDTLGLLADAISRARDTYQRLVNKIQGVFLKHLEKSGWPPAGRLANADVFDKLVAPLLQESGRRVALLLIDALRYELGVELHKQLPEGGQIELQPAYVQLPSVTPVGMASLLPGAGQQLKLLKKDDGMAPVLGDQPLTTVAQRMDILRKRYGQRFAETTLLEFVKRRVDLPSTVELLVIRSNEMDSNFESNPEAAPSLISRTFQQIRSAIHKLRGLGFQDAIIVTDHGFYMNTAAGAGDVCTKPSGKWLTIHERLLLGDGISDAANAVLPAALLGIRSEFSQAAIPRAMVAYKAGQWYFHGGASLQESLVPVIALRFRPVEAQVGRQPNVTLHYKRGAKRITTRLPVLEVEVGPGDLFSMSAAFDMLIEAYDRQGNVVGELKPGGPVNPATKMVTLKPGDIVQVTLQMALEFEGKFTVKALDPTMLTTFSKIDLETSYTV